MSKTKLTKDIETALYHYCYELGQILVDEVTMGNAGIVDTLSLEMKGNREKGYDYVWRFFEIKVSRQDFYSTNKLTFLGHFNYFVMPYDIYVLVKKDIPKMVGVLTYSGDSISLVKKPIRQKELKVKDNVILRNLLNSMNREVFKAKQVEKGLQVYDTAFLMKEILKRIKNSKSDFIADLILQSYVEDKKEFVKLLIDNRISAEYKELILSIMSKEYFYLIEDVKKLNKEYREERRLKREALLRVKELEKQINLIY